jgi:hypothetical protein
MNVSKMQRGQDIPRGTFVKNCLDDVCREHNLHKHYLYKKQEEDQPPYVDCIFVEMSDSLDDLTYNIHKELIWGT